ncbi:MAG: hypothetical protein CMP20_02645 [Rickettsiales bacterium]|nr:hypothetical protein [Rickettsiales bacterium]
MSLAVTDCSLEPLNDGLTIAYATSLGVFALAELIAFLLIKFSNPRESIVYTNILFTLQIVLYTALLLGQGSFYEQKLGICLPWLRWAVYAFSCALLALKKAKRSGMTFTATVLFVAMISLTLLLGAFSAASATLEKRWGWFGLGFWPYLIAILVLYRARSPGLFWFVLITWTFYPIIYLFGPALLNMYSTTVESWLYLAADVGFTKIAFEAYDYMTECKKSVKSTYA